MNGVLRGRNFSLEQSLGALAAAMKREFPPHMLRIPGPAGPAHNVLCTAFCDGEPRFYTIDLVFASDRKSFKFCYTRHVNDKPVLVKPRTPRMAIGGSGSDYLTQEKKWMRSLLRMVRANDRGQVSSLVVADCLAKLNDEVHRGIRDNSVGERCIVAWRHRKGGVHKGGGAHQFYTGKIRESDSTSIPIMSHGQDLQAFFQVVVPEMQNNLMAMMAGQEAKEMNRDEINAKLARLPDKPDESFVSIILDRASRQHPAKRHADYCAQSIRPTSL